MVFIDDGVVLRPYLKSGKALHCIFLFVQNFFAAYLPVRDHSQTFSQHSKQWCSFSSVTTRHMIVLSRTHQPLLLLTGIDKCWTVLCDNMFHFQTVKQQCTGLSSKVYRRIYRSTLLTRCFSLRIVPQEKLGFCASCTREDFVEPASISMCQKASQLTKYQAVYILIIFTLQTQISHLSILLSPW